MKYGIVYFLAAAALMCGCSKNSGGTSDDVQEQNVMTLTQDVLTGSFIGNGPQWGGYDMIPAWIGSQTLSDEDWNTVFDRVSFMRPGMVRIMVSQGWNYIDGTEFNPAKSDAILGKILDYCQRNGITVQFGEWGHVGGSAVDQTWVENAVSFLSYLVKDKGYTCIRYYTLVNEPNGNWSSTNGNYNLWSSVIKAFYSEMERKGLNDMVEIMGPDVAIWTISETVWMSNTKNLLHDQVRAYDIHTYPDDKTVYTTEFTQLLEAYRAASDKSRPITLGELGFKYDASSVLGQRNLERIKADRYAADDSQMNVYDSYYGVDMADATIQAMRAGYCGVTYWMLDDAMYNDTGDPSSLRLKKWGFWNILGSEKFGNPDDESIRPWFYPVSLLCRYFPAGTQILDVTLPKPVLSGMRAVAGVKDGKVTVAIVNNSSSDYAFTLKSTFASGLDGMDMYSYVAGEGAEYEGTVDASGFPVAKSGNESLSASASGGIQVTVPADSFVLYTNMD